MVKFLFFPFLSAFCVKFIRYLIDNGANPCYNTIRYLTKRTGGIMPTIDEDILGMLRRLNAMSRRRPKPNDPDLPPADSEPGDTPPEKKTHGRGRLVALLMDNGPMAQSQLAAHLGIRPQSLSELICKVEADGMVSRRQSEEDKRQTIVSLTDKGRASVESFRSAHKKHAEEFLSPLTEEEKLAFSSILRKLIDARTERED